MLKNAIWEYFDTTMKKELDTGFIQFYDGVYDNVQMRNNGVVTNVIFYNPNPPASYDERQSTTFLVSDELKDVIKQLNPSDFVNLYNEIAANLDENINSFEIHSYDGKTRKTLNRVIIIS